MYYKQYSSLKNKNFVITVIPECNIHDTVAVHLFLKYLTDLLKSELPETRKIIFFCAAQSKNCKNFSMFVGIKMSLELMPSGISSQPCMEKDPVMAFEEQLKD